MVRRADSTGDGTVVLHPFHVLAAGAVALFRPAGTRVLVASSLGAH